MNNLRRELAPISTAAWDEIDDEARRVLRLKLAGRKLVDFEGPLGSAAAAITLGRTERLRSGPVPEVSGVRRLSQPLVEMTTTFELSRAELDAVEHGAADPDLAPLIAAATRMAQAEDTAIFHGYAEGNIQGIDKASPHSALTIAENYETYPRTVAEAARLLRISGIDGPYGIALGPRCYTGVMQATAQGGYPILELIRKTIDGPVVWAPAVDGAVVLSVRGGDFQLTVGRDLSIGYLSHTDSTVRLYFVETMTFRALMPEAAVALKYANTKAAKRR